MVLIPKNVAAFAFAIGMMVSAHGTETFTFHSGAMTMNNPLDTASFTLTFTTPSALPDGLYQWATNNVGEPNTHIPAGFTFQFSDGYTTLTDPADLSPVFQFRLTDGRMNYADGTLELVAEDPSSLKYDPYVGYTSFFVDAGGTGLQDFVDPQIIGIEYLGHHFPDAAGGAGTWTYSISDTAAVPEPASYGLLTGGLALMTWVRRSRGGGTGQPTLR